MEAKSVRVLIVDDVYVLRKVYLELFRQVARLNGDRVHVTCDEAESHRQAIAFVKDAPDARWFVCVDADMPNGEALEFLFALNTLALSHRPHIVLTSGQPLTQEEIDIVRASASVLKDGTTSTKELIDHLDRFLRELSDNSAPLD